MIENIRRKTKYNKNPRIYQWLRQFHSFCSDNQLIIIEITRKRSNNIFLVPTIDVFYYFYCLIFEILITRMLTLRLFDPNIAPDIHA